MSLEIFFRNQRREKRFFLALSKEGEYWKVISGGVFRIRYSKNKKIIHSAPEVRTSFPDEDELLPFEEDK